MSREIRGAGTAAGRPSAITDGATDRGGATPRQGVSRGLAADVERLASTLKPAQRRVLADLEARGADELTRAEYERIGLVSRSQAAYDLADLVQMGFLERIGAGRATQYRRAHPGVGRKRKWTDERIRTELEAFCAGRSRWPRANEFKASGRGELYLAASRYGGIEHWASEVGYEDAERTPAPSRPARRRPAAGPRVPRAFRPALAAVAGLAFALAATLGLGSGAPDRHLGSLSPTPTPAPPAHEPAETAVGGSTTAPAPALVGRSSDRGSVLLTLTAVRGSSWVTVRRGSPQGRVLYAGTLARGATARLRGDRLWIRIGAPWNLEARLGDRTLALRGARTGTVTSRGLRIALHAHGRPAAPRSGAAAPPPRPAPSTLATTAWPVSANPSPPPPPPPPAPSPPAPPPPPAGPSPDPPPGPGPGPDPIPGP